MSTPERRFEIVEFPLIADEKGGLVPFEFNESFPFPVKRTYFVTAKKDGVRGGHAHLIEDELFFAVSGSITAELEDEHGLEEVILDTPNKAIWIKTGCWHEFKNFSSDAVLGAFSSTHYLPGEGNYVMDREVFRENF